jgi:hypothetical protein
MRFWIVLNKEGSCQHNRCWFGRKLPYREDRTDAGRRCCENMKAASGSVGFWKHAIRDERDYAAHTDYLHFNPVRHGLARTPAEWAYSSFGRARMTTSGAGGCAAETSR